GGAVLGRPGAGAAGLPARAGPARAGVARGAGGRCGSGPGAGGRRGRGGAGRGVRPRDAGRGATGAGGGGVMSRVEEYLRIPEPYCNWLGGLRWSANGEAIESTAEDPAIGLTFAMAPEVALFLRGLESGGPLVCFGFVLHLLHLLGAREATARAGEPFHVRQPAELAHLFHELGRPLRNAGALCARLCED